MVRVLIVGNGAREHVLAEALDKSPARPTLFAYMSANNPGIRRLCDRIEIGNLTEPQPIVDFAKKVQADFALIGPEAPLAAGVADVLEDNGVPCIGPRKDLARLETSKGFTRQLLERHGIPGNPKFKVFTNPAGIQEFIEELGEYVVKADGLHAGKGVKVSGDHLKNTAEAVKYAEDCIESDGSVVIEEKINGEEFSLMVFTDGKTVRGMPCVQDHKRAYENDEGPNTGGMGSYSDADSSLPFLTPDDIRQAMEINERTCKALHEEFNSAYKGIMYGGFMATRDGVKLIEYNARFGDPEAMNVMPLLMNDFVAVCQAILAGTLAEQDVHFAHKATVCKYIVPEGYPQNPVKGEQISIERYPSAKYYYAAIDEQDGKQYMTGSRALALVGIADTPEEAEQIAERAACGITGRVFHRKDIGTAALREKRIEHMRQLR